MVKVEKKVKKIKGNTSYAYIIAGAAVLVVLCIIILLSIKNANTQYTVQNGTIENTELTTAYVIKDELVVDKDMTKVILPIVSEGHRVAKGSILATYKGGEYEKYLNNLKKMDEEILELMKDLPTVYSSEIEDIESQIYSLIKSSNNETSYIKMQEYKTGINGLINKRAELIGDLSPDGAAIKDKIEQRNSYVVNAKKSNDNIIAKTSGIVSYETDGLEKILSSRQIDSYSESKLRESCKNISISNDKIKIVNNYEAYLIAKVSKDNFNYMKANKTYSVRLMGDETYTFEVTLYNINEVENGYDVIFKIKNGIEHLIGEREVEIEIVWWNSNGLFVSNDALKVENNINYVKVIKYGNYVDVPVKIIKQNEKYSIIDNYTTKEIKDLALDRKYLVKVYDNLVVESSERRGE